MKTIRKTFLSGLLVFFVFLMWGNGTATLSQAAGGLVIYVDDTPNNNGSVKCPATDVHSLDDAIAAIGATVINVTLYICPGSYSASGDGLEFRGFTKLQIIGKGNPLIISSHTPIRPLFDVNDSQDVTIDGLTITGGGQLWFANHIPAISYVNTSGIIKNNTISAWRQEYSGPPPFVIGDPSIALYSIYVNGSRASDKVQVLNNTIYDSQDVGILVAHSLAAMKIVKNRVVFASAIVPGFAPAIGVKMQAGIALVNSGPGTVISGNQVTSDTDLFPTAPLYSRGIMVYGTPGTKVIGNVVRGTVAQITVENHCNRVGVSADDNVVSGNKLYDSWRIAIYITARNDTVTPTYDCQTTPHADSITVTGNTIYNLDFSTTSSPYGHYGIYLDPVGGVIAGVNVKGNTIAGYLWEGSNPNTVHYSDQTGIPGAVLGPNKIQVAPPAGTYK